MDKWAPLVPDNTRHRSSLTSRTSITRKHQPSAITVDSRWIGHLPESLHVIIISYLPVSEIPKLARCSRAFGRLVREDKSWERRWLSLRIPKDEWPAVEPNMSERGARAGGGSVGGTPRKGQNQREMPGSPTTLSTLR